MDLKQRIRASHLAKSIMKDDFCDGSEYQGFISGFKAALELVSQRDLALVIRVLDDEEAKSKLPSGDIL